MDTFNDIWKEVLSICKSQVSEVMYNMWLAPLELVKYENDTVIFLINAEYKKTIIMEKFCKLIKDSFEQVLGFPVEIDIIVDKTLGESKSTIAQTEEKNEDAVTNSNPYAAYTFDNFIVGNSNNFAYNISVGVAAKPGSAYNPLLIYGRSGLGKTHLMFAIYNEIKKNNPDAVIIYTTGENFMNELVEGLSKKNTITFHNKFRNVDALLVDDIQFIQKGVSVQEEFFHTFNALYHAGKQIVLTSDVPPSEMEVLDERLRTRFEMGVLADVQPPDIDTRKAIIKRKCQQLGINLNDNITEYIAQKIKNNVRQLEGTVKKIEAMSKAYGTPVTIDTVQNIIKDITTDNQPVSVTVDKIIDNVSKTFGVTSADIKSDKRQANITLTRQLAMFVIKEVTGLTLKDIGALFGKNHSTVLHSISTAEEKMKESPQLKGTVNNIIRDFQEK